MSRETHVVTGGTSGMGLHVVRCLLRADNTHVFVGARRPETAHQLLATKSQDRLTILPLDLDNLGSVEAFAAEVRARSTKTPLRSIVCNAGLQLTRSKQTSDEGVERTFLVNALSHVMLADLLLPLLAETGRVITVGSGTHNPQDKIARLFGFRGAVFPSFAALVDGDLTEDGSEQQRNMDRYAASKLCAIYHAIHLAGEMGDEQAALSFDPGLMPGTELARDRSAIERFGWRYVLPALRPILNGVSSAEHSAEALVSHCINGTDHPSGSYVEFTGRPAPRSDLSNDRAKAAEFVEGSRELLKKTRAI